NTKNLKSGILEITAFNKDNIPLAERLTFIDNWEYKQDAEIKTDTLGLSQRAKNHFTFSVTDSLTGDFSVAVTDADFDSQLSPGNIISSFLMTDELKGYIHNPAYYFSSLEDSVTNALDLLLMTNGWRKFTWQQLLKDSIPNTRFAEPRFISLNGTAYYEGTKRPFAKKEIAIFVITQDSSHFIFTDSTDEKGRFSSSPLLFTGPAKLLITENNSKHRRFISVTLDSIFLLSRQLLPVADSLEYFFIKQESKVPLKWEMDTCFIAQQRGLTLNAVTVKSFRKTPLEKLEERYLTGLFNSGFSDKTIDLVDNPNAYGGPLIDFLRDWIPGVTVHGGPGNYILNYRNSGGLSGSYPMTVYLDEFRADADLIAFIPINQVALIKVYNSFVGEPGNGIGGVLAIYTKKGEDMNVPEGKTIVNTIGGYSVSKIFYSPDYNMPAINNQPDNRITLYWNPDLFFNGKKLSVPFTFYNNDRTHRFKITVEGMTADGKLVSVQRFVQ
ncbi:MAG: hypothetical protein JSU05_12875, partial [Bacteroidetes bacterium]|nr:hypothetical protein [Bacteroidota bacterium]